MEGESCRSCGSPVQNFGFRDELRQYEAKRRAEQAHRMEKKAHEERTRMLAELGPRPWGDGVSFEDGEEVVHWEPNFKEFFEDRSASVGARVGNKGFFIVTNRRVIFAAKLGLLSKTYAPIYSTYLEDIVTVSQGKFGFNDKLVLVGREVHRDFIREDAQRTVPVVTEAIRLRKRELEDMKRRERVQVQVVMDFSGLKRYLEEGGMSLQAVKCGQCGAKMTFQNLERPHAASTVEPPILSKTCLIESSH